MLHKTLLIGSCLVVCFSFAQPSQKKADSLKNVLQQHTTRDTNRVLTLIKYVNALFYVHPDRSIMKYADEALQISEEVKWKMGIANSLQMKGIVYDFFWNDPIQAFDCYQKALKINESIGNKGFQLTTLVDIGVMYFNREEYEQALLYFNQAYVIMQQQNLKIGEDQLLMNMATAYNALQQNTKAEEFYTKSIALAEKAGNLQNIANILCSRGQLYRNEKKLIAAKEDLGKGIALAENNHFMTIWTEGLINLAETNIDLKDYSAAEKYAQKALQLSHQANMRQLQARALGTLVDLYSANGYAQKAVAYYKQYQPMHDSLLNDETKQSLTRMEMQYAFNKTQDSIKAVTDKQQALAAAQIQQQRFIKNTTLAGAGFLFLAGIGGFAFYKRNRDIRFKQQITDTEMKALRAQMNPHFIFNSLNSISNFVIKNNTQKADEYLTKFARLMRLILENSEQKEVSLSDDLKALELYMQLEALRLENKFTYEIQVADDIDKDNTLIPPLILQPFVENSIWHGLTKKNGDGKIIIKIQKENNMLLYTVEDNGIGRDKAKEREDIKPKERKSFGLKITHARIDIINKIKNSNAAVMISDLSEGTKAEVRLPLELSF